MKFLSLWRDLRNLVRRKQAHNNSPHARATASDFGNKNVLQVAPREVNVIGPYGLNLMNRLFSLRQIGEADQEIVQSLLVKRWGSQFIASKGKLIDGTMLPGYIATATGGDVVGLITLDITDDGCEIISLDSFTSQQGVGTALIEAGIEHARGAKCQRIWVVTTNDNLEALRFYQKRGMRMKAIYPGAIDRARQTLKSEIPEIGEHGISLRDEIELELVL